MAHKSLPPWGNAAAGATGAVIANALVYPLDIVKTRIQVQTKLDKFVFRDTDSDDVQYSSTADAIKRILEDEGLAGLYAGFHSSLIGVASTNFVYFYWYSVVRRLYLSTQSLSQPPTTVVELSLGAAAGALAQIFTIPVSVITTRQQTAYNASAKGLIATGQEIVRGEDGWRGLWRGLKASLVLVINPAITYGAYERLRHLMFSGKEGLQAWEAFALGASAKAAATVITQPLIVAKVGLQSKPPKTRAGAPFKSFIDVLQFIVKTEGMPALFKGLGAQILKGILVQGLLMMIKDRIEIVFGLLFAYARRVRAKRVNKTIGQFVRMNDKQAALRSISRHVQRPLAAVLR